MVDDGRTDPATRAMVQELERSRVRVVRSCSGAPDVVERVNEAVREYFRDWSEPSRYGVATRPSDVRDLSRDSLRRYDDLLDRYPQADGAGPAEDAAGPVLVSGGLELGFALYRPVKPIARTMLSVRVSG